MFNISENNIISIELAKVLGYKKSISTHTWYVRLYKCLWHP
jgi:hypothetical protein